ncbi:MAG TPA: hypothetical protein VHB51_00775 [Candidatus Saccharimonadales bacterium]|nr:hypothetical protein [Candidatus Saccharimonadales bacterium]
MAKDAHSTNFDHESPLQGEPVQPINWTASEFIAHQKTAGWYLILALVAAAFAGVIYLITRDEVSAAAVIIAAIFLGAYANRQPRQLSYELSGQHLKIGEKTYNYQTFRSFSLMPEGPFTSITFWPLKRFGTPVSVYFDPDDGDKILELLTLRLPQEQPRRDPIDNLMRRIRF